MSSNAIYARAYEYDFSHAEILRHGLSGVTGCPRQATTAYFVDDRQIAGTFGNTLSPLLADLVDVAMAAYFADRISPRLSRDNYECQWPRRFRLKLGVRLLDLWQREDIREDLANLLHFFTDDHWVLEFVARQQQLRTSEVQRSLLPLPLCGPARVALYSGGLDSFAGAVQQISGYPEHEFTFVSAATHNRQAASQRRQVKELRKLTKRAVSHVQVPLGIKWGGRKHEKEETSQRTRGFLFLALGIATALNAGLDSLFLYENGIGALNLPYISSQVGTMSSRAVNPLSLLRMERFVNHLTGKQFSILNPFLFQTKGQMCQHPTVQSSADHIKLTFSCDGFPLHEAQKDQCGRCTSCLLRRVSLEYAGLSDYDGPTRYLADLSLGGYFPATHLKPLSAMEWQYERLCRCFGQTDVWQNLTVEYPSLQSVVSEFVANGISEAEACQNSLVRLYEQYLEEWYNFSARQCLKVARAA